MEDPRYEILTQNLLGDILKQFKKQIKKIILINLLNLLKNVVDSLITGLPLTVMGLFNLSFTNMGYFISAYYQLTVY